MTNPAIIICLFLLTSWAHPLHVSVCEIAFDSQSKSLEISQRIFIDDFELALREHTDNPKLNLFSPPPGTTTDQLIGQYLGEHLKIQLGGKPVVAEYLGHEIEAEAVWCYLEVKRVKKLRQVKVQNSVLCSVYDDQVNLVHVAQGERIKSMKLTPKKAEGEVVFGD